MEKIKFLKTKLMMIAVMIISVILLTQLKNNVDMVWIVGGISCLAVASLWYFSIYRNDPDRLKIPR